MSDYSDAVRALNALRQGILREQVLKTCKYCGLTSQELAELECGPGVVKDSVRATLLWLSKPGLGFPVFLIPMTMKLAGRKGRPQKAFALTEFGATALNLLDENLSVRAPKPHNDSAQHHRFAQLDIVTQALRNGWQPEVEKILRYGNGSEIRCDLVISHPQQKQLYIEVEQELTRNHAERAYKKFSRWQDYAKSLGSVLRLYIAFNVPDKKLGSTLDIWREALERIDAVEDLILDVYYILLGPLDGMPLEIALNEFSVRMEMEAGLTGKECTQEATAPASEPIFYERILHPAPDLLPEFERLLDAFWTAKGVDRLRTFAALMKYIYDASYSPESKTYLYCEMPTRSLWLLRHYLNLPQNAVMLEDLNQALLWMERKNLGLIMLRNTMTRILWRTFLGHHGFATGGVMRVFFHVPDYQDVSSEFTVKVDFSSAHFKEIFETELIRDEACQAIGWALSSFFLYPEVLGGRDPWKRKKSQKAD